MIFTSSLLLTILSIAPESTIIAPGAKPELLQETGAGEGPAWYARLGLLTSGEGNVNLRSRDGKQSVFMEDSGSNGLLIDRQGRIVIADAKRRRIVRRELDGKITVLADRFDGMRFNQPNDLALDAKGRIYFSDPQYGGRAEMEMRDAAGKTVEGVYRIDPDGKVSRVIGREVERANGLVVSLDGKFLYVADNNNNTEGGARKLWRFDRNDDGSVDLKSQKLLQDWGKTRGPDGIKIDSKGRLFVAAGLNRPNPPFEIQDKATAGIYVFTAEGEPLELIPIPRDECTNCAFGGDDLKTLFVTAGGTLWSIKLREPGVVFWP